MAPKKYISDETGRLVLSPEYKAWKNAPHSNVWVSKDDDENFPNEEGAIPATATNTAAAVAVATTSVIQGKYDVPEGVAVEEFKNFNGKKDLLNDCPKSVRNLLSSKNGAFDLYDKLVQTIYDDKTTRGMLGKWKDRQIISILDAFRDDFAEKGIRVVLCKRLSGNGHNRWIEYIDVDLVGDTYVPQYNVLNMSGQVIKTAHHTLEFPNGVAVEELQRWKGRKRLKEHIPIQVEKMVKDHDLMNEYDHMVDEVVEACTGSFMKGGWNLDKLKLLNETYRPIFAQKGIILYICHKEEYVDHGGKGGHTEHYRWIEFVDHKLQPNYISQRSADVKQEKACSIM